MPRRQTVLALLAYLVQHQQCICLVHSTNAIRSARSTGKASTALTMKLGFKRRRVQNASGQFFVDESCTDCDVCRWMAPQTFVRSGLGSIVEKQPKSEEDVLSALRAMLACPSGSIRTMTGDAKVKEAFRQFPLAVEPQELQGVFHLGFHTVESGGSTPYLVVPPSGQNVMVDVPRSVAGLRQQWV